MLYSLANLAKSVVGYFTCFSLTFSICSATHFSLSDTGLLHSRIVQRKLNV